jgi:hypothetical protein
MEDQKSPKPIHCKGNLFYSACAGCRSAFRSLLNLLTTDVVVGGNPVHALPQAAAICRAAGEPLTIEDIVVDPPRAYELRIKIVCTSLCHTDIAVWLAKIEVSTLSSLPRIEYHLFATDFRLIKSSICLYVQNKLSFGCVIFFHLIGGESISMNFRPRGLRVRPRFPFCL